MEGLLLRIKMLLNENTELLVKRIDKLDAKFETLANRVRNLERRKPKVEKLKQDEPDFVLNSCSCFQNYDME
jgi:predicted nuclease with TOPRIM domain